MPFFMISPLAYWSCFPNLCPYVLFSEELRIFPVYRGRDAIDTHTQRDRAQRGSLAVRWWGIIRRFNYVNDCTNGSF